MPKVNIGKPKRDKLMELVLGRKAAMKISEEDMAIALGCSRSTLRKRFAAGSDSWTVADIKVFSRVLDVPIEEMRAAIRM